MNQYTSIDGRIKLFNCDCMELMKSYPDNHFDLAIVDPPYGSDGDAIDLKNNKEGKKQATKRTVYNSFENIPPDESYFSELKRISKLHIVWGGNFFGLSGGVIAWNKNGTAFGEGEIAICNTHKSVRFFEFTWNGMIQGDMKEKEVRIHSTQKPVKLYKWVLSNFAKPGYKIFDSHLGSGSHAIACHDYGFELTACELKESIFTDCLNRFKQHEKQIKPSFIEEKNNDQENFQQKLFES